MSSAAMVFAADAAFGKGYVLRQVRVQVVAYHEHVEVLVDGVYGVRPSGVGRTWQDVRFATDAQDVRRMSAAGPF